MPSRFSRQDFPTTTSARACRTDFPPTAMSRPIHRAAAFHQPQCPGPSTAPTLPANRNVPVHPPRRHFPPTAMSRSIHRADTFYAPEVLNEPSLLADGSAGGLCNVTSEFQSRKASPRAHRKRGGDKWRRHINLYPLHKVQTRGMIKHHPDIFIETGRSKGRLKVNTVRHQKIPSCGYIFTLTI